MTSETYEPNPNLLVAELPLVKHAGACVVRGTVNGTSGLILLDPAGDFEVMAGPGMDVSLVQLGEKLRFSNPQVSNVIRRSTHWRAVVEELPAYNLPPGGCCVF